MTLPINFWVLFLQGKPIKGVQAKDKRDAWSQLIPSYQQNDEFMKSLEQQGFKVLRCQVKQVGQKRYRSLV